MGHTETGSIQRQGAVLCTGQSLLSPVSRNPSLGPQACGQPNQPVCSPCRTGSHGLCLHFCDLRPLPAIDARLEFIVLFCFLRKKRIKGKLQETPRQRQRKEE